MTCCVYCGKPVDETTAYQRVTGWTRKAQAASRRGGGDVVARERGDEWACAGCVSLLQRGIPVGQAGLFGEAA